ncbi:SLC26A/SulP transporter family protein [Denitrobaculum tricleocarpae]|uniref:Cyclic nucleotide-binding domain-containing protein n=1 Tax=Denitrobaculum tricleocarpae TaxID=2591009 RepID=A0A545TU19_9PROT|nr:SulP family inorganic anion transporter [Denitrobaculum tricleocarpae]TQV80708.1 cyclic nucleotide-binding domain-containing protein [Denitrobaculum tricleocarpae]
MASVNRQQGLREGSVEQLLRATILGYSLRQIAAALAAGLICGLLAVIFAISDAALLFSGDLSHHVTIGIGICLFSTIVLAAVVALGSSYPGMLALSQEVTIVTLAVIAASMHTAMEGIRSEEEITLTIVVAIGLATSVTGLCLFTLGIFRLGRFVRFIPYPVIGGFLAGMGWLIVHGALGVIIGETLTPDNVSSMFDQASVAKWAPAALFAGLLWVFTRGDGGAVVLPIALGVALLLFHGVAWLLGQSQAELQAGAWLFQTSHQDRLWPPLPDVPLSQIDWPVIWAEAPKVATMVVVTAISVLLASSGVELTVRRDVELNRELRAAGVGNFFAGLGGGAAGFQGLGLSLLGHKLDAPYRLVGLIAAVVCAAMLFFGTALLAYMPIPLFGGLLLWIGFSLLHEWLVGSFSKMPWREYLIILVILLVVGTAGFLEGVMAGLIFAVVLFVLDYSRVEIIRYAVTGENLRSSADRTTDDRQFLMARGQEVLVLRLQGFVFFGTAHKLQAFVRERMFDKAQPKLRFLVLDCGGLTGLDSSAVRSFIKIAQLTDGAGTILLPTNLDESVSQMLAAGGFGPQSGLSIRTFRDVDQALAWSEDCLLEEKQLALTRREDDGIEDLLAEAIGDPQVSLSLLSYLEKRECVPRDIIIHQGAEPKALYFIERGRVNLLLKTPDGSSICLRTFSAGVVVGELAFYLKQPHSASLVTEGDAILWRLSRGALAKMGHEAPATSAAFHRYLVRILAERLSLRTR